MLKNKSRFLPVDDIIGMQIIHPFQDLFCIMKKHLFLECSETCQVVGDGSPRNKLHEDGYSAVLQACTQVTGIGLMKIHEIKSEKIISKCSLCPIRYALYSIVLYFVVFMLSVFSRFKFYSRHVEIILLNENYHILNKKFHRRLFLMVLLTRLCKGLKNLWFTRNNPALQICPYINLTYSLTPQYFCASMSSKSSLLPESSHTLLRLCPYHLCQAQFVWRQWTLQHLSDHTIPINKDNTHMYFN